MKITASSSIISWQIHGETIKRVTDFIFLDSKITADSDCSCGGKIKKKKKTLCPWKKSYEKPWQHTKKQRHYFTSKGLYSQTYGFSRSCDWVWELDYKESWAPKNWCFLTVVLDKTVESPLDCKEIQPAILKEISPEYSLEGLMLRLNLHYFGQLMGRTDSL